MTAESAPTTTMEDHMTQTEHTARRSPSAGPLVSGDSSLADVLTARLEKVEERLAEAVAQTRRLPDETSRHLLAAGGKRVRPLLVLLTSHLGDPEREGIVAAAAAVELIHLATLYHDDVMDDAPMRRGVPSAHEVWGNSVAILTGDVLFARASLLSAGLGPEAVKLQSTTFERLVIGQLEEFTGPEDGDDPIEHYISVLAGKTGSLIAASGEFGLLCSGAPEEYFAMIRDYGERVGVAFQLADDIIDLVSDGDVTGKTPGTDLREGVPTMPVLLVRRAAAAGDEAAAEVVRLLEADLSGDEALEAARQALIAHPATDEARAEARRWADEAIAAVSGLPEGEVRESLIAFAHSVVDRSA